MEVSWSQIEVKLSSILQGKILKKFTQLMSPNSLENLIGFRNIEKGREVMYCSGSFMIIQKFIRMGNGRNML